MGQKLKDKFHFLVVFFPKRRKNSDNHHEELEFYLQKLSNHDRYLKKSSQILVSDCLLLSNSEKYGRYPVSVRSWFLKNQQQSITFVLK